MNRKRFITTLALVPVYAVEGFAIGKLFTSPEALYYLTPCLFVVIGLQTLWLSYRKSDKEILREDYHRQSSALWDAQNESCDLSSANKILEKKVSRLQKQIDKK